MYNNYLNINKRISILLILVGIFFTVIETHNQTQQIDSLSRKIESLESSLSEKSHKNEELLQENNIIFEALEVEKTKPPIFKTIIKEAPVQNNDLRCVTFNIGTKTFTRCK
jgi:uncharacterized protein YoxC